MRTSLPHTERLPGSAADAADPLKGAQRLGPREVGTLVLITLIAASCFVAIRAAAGHAPPLRFAALRLLAGGALLVPLLPAFHQPLLPPRRYLAALILLALAATALGYGAMFASPGLAGAGLASVLGNVQPLLVLAAGPWLLGEALTRRNMLALALGLAGVALVLLPAFAKPDALRFEAGAALALASSAGLALGTIVVRRLGPGAPVLTLTAWQLLLGSLPLWLASSLREGTSPTVWSPAFIAILLYLAVGGTTFVTAAWYRLLAHHDAGRLALFFFLVPAFGLAFARIFLGEAVTPLRALGSTLVVASALATVWPSPPATPSPRPGSARPRAGRATPSRRTS